MGSLPEGSSPRGLFNKHSESGRRGLTCDFKERGKEGPRKNTLRRKRGGFKSGNSSFCSGCRGFKKRERICNIKWRRRGRAGNAFKNLEAGGKAARPLVGKLG